ncbi:MAG TPA: DUF6600 domain-containing protein [Pyrinomonadaceae bacterium]|nr:DUF6600 domain-containing protein [Pyrinomonadaceae bacterium]
MRALRRPTISICLFLLFTLLATFNITVRADDDNDTDEYEESARVARVSMIRGDVQLQRNGSKTWESARVNFPLVEGDTLATTGQDARFELQIDARNYVRVSGDSILRVVSLRDEGVALSLSEGVATIRLARFDRNKEYFEIDAPGTTLAAEKRGVYRLDVSQTGSVRLTVRDGGQARIYSETSGFALRDGRSAELINNGTDAGDWELSRAESFDSWDRWVDERERDLATRLHYDGRDRYYDSDVWGAEELDAYGDWVYASDYGWVWRPYSTAVSNYSNWAPYRYGHWTWCPPYGWTWVGDESWGWAPYHYGRWVYYNNNWCWAPRGYGYVARRNWWRPALVVFAYVPTSYGERVCWYPLTYGQRDPRGRHYRRLDSLRSNDVARLQRTNPAFLRAITSLPARDFGRHTAQTQQAPTDIARRAITAEPVRGRLPIQPADGSTTNAGIGEVRAPRSVVARPPNSTGVVGTLSERPTGAAARTPGVALDGELRRTRLFNGREIRPPSGASENGVGNSGNSAGGNAGVVDPGNTGVVARPARARSADRSPAERGNQGNSGDSGTPWYERPARPARVNPGVERGPSPTPSPTIERPDGGDAGTVPAPAPRVRSISPRRGDGNDGGVEPAARPARRPETRPETGPESQPETRPESRPEPRPEPRSERPERSPETRPETRPEPRSERPEPRSEPRPESRPEPRPESRPEPRQEPRQESRPEPRSEPAPQREQPKSEESKPSAPPQRERSADAPARPSKSRDNR